MVNRRKILRSLGASGFVITGGQLLNNVSGKQIPEIVEHDNIAVKMRRIGKKPDFVNVDSNSMKNSIVNGNVEKKEVAGVPAVKFFNEENIDQSSPLCAISKHKLENGNSCTASVILDNENDLIMFIEFNEIQGGRKTYAQRYSIIERVDSIYPFLQSKEISINGDKPNRIDETSELVTQDDNLDPGGGGGSSDDGPPTPGDDCDECHGCHGAPPGGWNGEYQDVTCDGVDLTCVSVACASCYNACYTKVTCAFCLAVRCAPALALCCDSYSNYCATCANGINPNC